MAIRLGMQTLVDRVRALTGAGTAEYVAGSITYFTDQHLQDILDGNYVHFANVPLVWRTEQIGGTVNYLNAQAPYRDLEEAASGTARWAVRDGAGSFIGTANYTANYRTGEISWGTVNQAGSAYYLTGYSYDLCAAAVDVLQGRLTNFAAFWDFSADNQSFSRSQAFDHFKERMNDLRACVGENVVGAVSGDMHVSEFVRVDINSSCDPWPWGWT